MDERISCGTKSVAQFSVGTLQSSETMAKVKNRDGKKLYVTSWGGGASGVLLYG